MRTIGLSLTTDVIPASDLRKRVKMTPIAPNWSAATPVQTPEFTVRYSQGRYIVSGRDKTNKPWRASLSPAGRGIWRVDGQAGLTYYFAGYTGAVGIGPPTWILALNFDALGRPNPFYVDGHSHYDSNGIFDVVNLDGTGPQLIQQDWCFSNGEREEQIDAGGVGGFWITTLYQQQNGYWRRIDGQHGARVFPLFEKWSRESPEPARLVAPSSVPKRCSVDHGNDPAAGFRARISGVNKHEIVAEGGFGCNKFLPKLVVSDSRLGREIEIEDIEVGPVLRAVAKTTRTVVLTGISTNSEPNRCGVSVLWATEP